MEEMSMYRFVLIIQRSEEEDWVDPEFTQALVVGTVPIYLGAKNIEKYLPGENSIVHLRDFDSGEELAKYMMKDPEALYKEKTAWRQNGLSPSFQEHLDNCVHYAECRICKHIHR